MSIACATFKDLVLTEICCLVPKHLVATSIFESVFPSLQHASCTRHEDTNE